METKKSQPSSAWLALSNTLADAVERAACFVVAVNARPRTPSSGVYWRPGVVVTADHTVKQDQEITVTLADGRAVPATLAGRDPTTDLAVLKLQTTETPAAEIGDASTLKVGHLVLAIGRREPLRFPRRSKDDEAKLASGAGETIENHPSASLGVVGALGGPRRTWSGGQIDRFVRLDLRIFLGFSGGPLVDAQGLIVGISTTGLWRNMALAVPASTVDRVAKELLEKGHIARSYLGMGMLPVRLPDALQSKLNLGRKDGMIVVSVEPGGPAERAGALIGDVLVDLDGKPMRDIADVQSLLAVERAGKALKASLVRGGAPIDLTITLGERPGIG